MSKSPAHKYAPHPAVRPLVLLLLLSVCALATACSNPERIETARTTPTIAPAPATDDRQDDRQGDTQDGNKPEQDKQGKQDKKARGSSRAVVAPLPEGLITRSRKIILPEPEGLQVGVLVPLHGTAAPLGNALLDAIGMAVADHAGGAAKSLRFLVFDSGDSPEEAALAAEQALAAGAGLVLGPLFADQADAAGKVLSPHGVSLLSFSNDLRVARQGVFILGRTPQSELAALIAQTQQQNLYRFAVFAPADDLGTVAIDSLRAYDEENHLDLVAEGAHNESDLIAAAAIQQFLSYAPLYDVLVLPSGPGGVAGIANSFAFHDPNFDAVRILTLASGNADLLRSEPALHRSWYAAPPEQATLRFVRRFESVLGYTPPSVTGLAYDAAAVAVLLYRLYQEQQEQAEKQGQAQTAPQTSLLSSPWGVAALTRPRGFSGVAGLFRLRRDGSNERALAVYEVTPDGHKLLATPPVRFGDRAN